MQRPIQIPGKGTNVLREGRFSGRNQIYHITSATHERITLFSEFAVARMVIHSLKREDEAGHTATMAFVLMPDPTHWRAPAGER